MKAKIRNPKTAKWTARRARVLRTIEGTGRVRLTVFRSAKHIYAQLVEPDGRTVLTVSTRTPGVVGDGQATGNVEAAKRVGEALARAAREKQIESVVFNRNGFLYHGRVRALAEAAREAGLQF